ncbi:putative DNA helicase (putative) [Lactobacillus selangorensis]|uniref:Putative DNA helicase (Putative) n=1 Tax=Lactobacillus selangorensis TaxID=81857 RepID=A0A0R2FJV7_9LACO|nr:ATP-dependent DNA helicase [Lactobacillus selangorensis]KRN27979.1 putative DNA helicase (putative) [Lactobacillus selangorensis]KRN30550.1 putative DNA helicase (putative) [Lactobacillus selangorensis]
MKKVGVRQLVEFILRSGDLGGSSNSSNTAQQGTRIHHMLQKQGGADYQKEVYLEQPVTLCHQDYLINGRADGVITTANETTIEEIKTSAPAFEDLPDSTLTLYWGQVQVYGHLLMEKEDLDQVTLQLTYYQTTTDQITRTQHTYTRKEAAAFFDRLIKEFESWLVFKQDLVQKRDDSIHQLDFPFHAYRPHQRELAIAVYKTILTQSRLFVEAPTGTGKTISTLFPAIKAIGENKIQRLFYLTAKQSTRRVAEMALELMGQQDLQVKSITLTARDKIQFPEEADLTPAENPYMVGYYDRLRPAIKDMLTHENRITRDVVEQYAQQYTLDPFEFSLDASLFCDVIICDYNYLFDPLVYLQRFFSEPDPDNFFLIDEAHNLVNRSRAMYSAALESGPLDELIKTARDIDEPGVQQLLKKMRTLKRAFNAVKKTLQAHDVYEAVAEAPLDSFNTAVGKWTDFVRDWLPERENDPFTKSVLDYFLTASAYLRISDLYDETFRTHTIRQPHNVIVKQLCLDPSEFLDQSLSLGGGAVFFSATLTPMHYYEETLGCKEDALSFRLPSPFPAQNQAILITQYIQTTYKQRASNLQAIVLSLAALVQSHQGNYLFFFPSYTYLDKVYTAFTVQFPDVKVARQETGMDAAARTAFLEQFQAEPDATLVGFAVLGGIFAEGIDLKGTRLSGAAVVSVGLPGLNVETDLVRNYFDKTNHHGFEYAYQLPGLNNVLQAAGRVIRSATDVGVVLLLDQRFASPRYTSLFPAHWDHYQRIPTLSRLKTTLAEFWEQHASKKTDFTV